jgi:tRNA-specific 2-thiouridylase
MKKKTKVYVGMSGGVDSSLSAALLKEQGYDVTGVFIKVWQPDFIECTWKEDRVDAMRVAAQLNIPFITLDLEKEYKQGVIDYMIEEYRKGNTPNPDVFCNKEVKFGAFLKWAKVQGAHYVATGHYAQTDNQSLFVSKDTNKDQTYFLWTLTKEQIQHVLFPIGNMTKDEVRSEAQKRGLYTSNKKDSQGLCFVGTVDIKTLLKNFIEEKKGDVLNEQGEVIGSHDGVTFFTIGERHGFTITSKGTDDKPYYIIAKDIDKNTLTVAHTPRATEHGEIVHLSHTNFIHGVPDMSQVYEARGRYRAPLATVQFIKNKEEYALTIISGDITYVRGQSLVVYKSTAHGAACLGGGIMR